MNTLLAQKVARVVCIGWQEAPEGMEGCMLYNIVAGEGLCVGSTVTLATLHRQGYFVEIDGQPELKEEE